VILTGSREQRNNLYRLNSWLSERRQTSSLTVQYRFTPITRTANLATVPAQKSIDLWHKRAIHLNYQSLYNLSHRDMVTGMPTPPREHNNCEACILGKYHCILIPKTRQTTTTRILKLVHSDLCCPLSSKYFNGSRYILTFIDDFSRYSRVYFLSAKSETFDTFKSFKLMVEKQTNQKLSTL
jgi:hypothetical protein